ncbi:MAG: nicotinate (nicotinamide) nucleotide adenylyltransferase [Thermosipho sp. (in: Bacteria)]|nr:nicotinate (nicotinamide) nucleotide adenylyltransferase [Thermosipho sp. (in: thermotogales)]
MGIQFGLPAELLNLENSIILFGGSFNPPHNGHVIIAQLVRELFKKAEMHVVVSSVPPHKEVNVPFGIRYELAKIAFKKLNLHVSDIEHKLGGISYAINTVEHYRKTYSNVFYLVGEDALISLEKWYKYQELLSKIKMLVYPRFKDAEILRRAESVLGKLSDSIYYLDLPLIQISSTIVRERLKKGLGVYGFVPDELIPYVEEVYGDR